MEVTMGVDRLPSGSYRARLMVDGEKCTATFPTKREAAEWVVVARGRVVRARAARRLTVGEYACRWLGEFIDTADGVDRYRGDVAEYIVPALGSRPLAEVMPAEIVALLEQVAREVSLADARQVRATPAGAVRRCGGRRHRRTEFAQGASS
jgi:hypothetical protein